MYYNGSNNSSLPPGQQGQSAQPGMPINPQAYMSIPPSTQSNQNFGNDDTGHEFDTMKQIQGAGLNNPMYSQMRPMDGGDKQGELYNQQMAYQYLNTNLIPTSMDLNPSNYMIFGGTGAPGGGATGGQEVYYNKYGGHQGGDQGGFRGKRDFSGGNRGGRGGHFNSFNDRNKDRGGPKGGRDERGPPRGGSDRPRSPRGFRDSRERRDDSRNDRKGGYSDRDRKPEGDRRYRDRDDRGKTDDRSQFKGRGDSRFDNKREGGDFKPRDNSRYDKGGDRDRDYSGSDRSAQNHQNDWKCPGCSNLNWARRTQCNRCGIEKPADAGGVPMKMDDKKPPYGGGNNMQGGANWRCPKCNGDNFPKRMECYKCKERRPADAKSIPQSGGYMGGGGDRAVKVSDYSAYARPKHPENSGMYGGQGVQVIRSRSNSAERFNK